MIITISNTITLISTISNVLIALCNWQRSTRCIVAGIIFLLVCAMGTDNHNRLKFFQRCAVGSGLAVLLDITSNIENIRGFHEEAAFLSLGSGWVSTITIIILFGGLTLLPSIRISYE